MGRSNLQASLEKKYAGWRGELLVVQNKIANIEASQQELVQLRERQEKLNDLVMHTEAIFGEVNPDWDPETVTAVKPGTYNLPFEIGTATREALSILRETGIPSTSRQLAKNVLERQGIHDAEWTVVDSVRGAIDVSFRKKRDKYVKGEGSWPIYWSILDPSAPAN